MKKTWIPLSAIALSLLSAAAFGYRAIMPETIGVAAEEAFSMDVPMTPQAASLLRTESTPSTLPNAWGVTPDTVGEADSFGRDAVHLGLAASYIALSPTCPRANAYPGELCQTTASPGALTTFSFNNVASIQLPSAATQSLLCQWLTPIIDINYRNATAGRGIGQFYYSPTLTVVSPVLDDPALINPLTGQPFGGRLITGMSAFERLSTPLEPGVAFNERTRKTTGCVAGVLNRSRLVSIYGLSETLADRFLASPMTLQLNVSGGSQHVDSVWMSLNLRLTGDGRM